MKTSENVWYRNEAWTYFGLMNFSFKLNKVNTVTLKDWLKGKGVRCKSSDKKEELVKKVEVFLGIYQEELKQQIMDFVSTPATAT